MPTVKTKRPPSIASLVDQLFALRAKKQEQADLLKAIEAEYKALETTIIDRMAEEGAEITGGKQATASVNKIVVANVEDWDAFYAFIHKHKYYHMLERRPAVAAFREMLELKGEVPGVVPFVKTNLNLRSR
jgi:hypothetical protein